LFFWNVMISLVWCDFIHLERRHFLQLLVLHELLLGFILILLRLFSGILLYLIILFCFCVQFLQRANENQFGFLNSPLSFDSTEEWPNSSPLFIFYKLFCVFGFLKKVSKIILLLYFFVFASGIYEKIIIFI
jgi:hypothetical protein